MIIRTTIKAVWRLVTVALVAWPVYGEDASGKTPTPKIIKSAQPVKIDGVLDDPVWKQAQAIDGHWLYAKKKKKSAKPRMTVRYAWDENFLYIGYEVFDANLIDEAVDEQQGPPNNRRQSCKNWAAPPKPQVDLAEFFLVFEEDSLFWEVHHTPGNLFNDILIVQGLPTWKKNRPAIAGWAGIYFARQEYIRDDGKHSFAKAVALKPKADGKASTVNQKTDKDTGYTAELRFPWFSIGTPANARTKIKVEGKKGLQPGPWKLAGLKMRILAVYQDGDKKDLYTTSCSETTRAMFHQQTKNFPTYVFDD